METFTLIDYAIFAFLGFLISVIYNQILKF